MNNEPFNTPKPVKMTIPTGGYGMSTLEFWLKDVLGENFNRSFKNEHCQLQPRQG